MSRVVQAAVFAWVAALLLWWATTSDARWARRYPDRWNVAVQERLRRVTVALALLASVVAPVVIVAALIFGW